MKISKLTYPRSIKVSSTCRSRRHVLGVFTRVRGCHDGFPKERVVIHRSTQSPPPIKVDFCCRKEFVFNFFSRRRNIKRKISAIKLTKSNELSCIGRSTFRCVRPVDQQRFNCLSSRCTGSCVCFFSCSLFHVGWPPTSSFRFYPFSRRRAGSQQISNTHSCFWSFQKVKREQKMGRRW